MTPHDARERMVKEQIIARGIANPRVLAAMRKVPRERFVDAEQVAQAYEDRPLPIGKGQTISQPFIVAKMTELAGLRGAERVLEIGAGCGYQTAILAECGAEVYGVEILPELAAKAQRNLAALGVKNARVECFDGTHGWPEHAPYQAIIVSAGAPRVPVLLLTQLAEAGRLVIPVGPRDGQRLVVVRRKAGSQTSSPTSSQASDEYETDYDIPVRFVDLTGKYGWGGEGPPSA